MNTLTVSNDPFWVPTNTDLEAALACIKEIFNNQMNSDNGLGELDIRYIDALIDNMGKHRVSSRTSKEWTHGF